MVPFFADVAEDGLLPDTSSRPTRRGPQLTLEQLEDRSLPSVFTPTTFTDGVSGDSQVKTLRNAIRSQQRHGHRDRRDSTLGGHVPTDTAGPRRADHYQRRPCVDHLRGRPNATSIDASGLNDRVFQIVNAGTLVTFQNLKITGGLAQDDGTAGLARHWGRARRRDSQ